MKALRIFLKKYRILNDFDGWVIAAGRYNINRKYDEWLDGSSGFNKLRSENDE